MASFNVTETVRIPADAVVRFLQPGAVYTAGDRITGLSAPEAGELLTIFPSAFEALDEEAQVVAKWAARKQVEAE